MRLARTIAVYLVVSLLASPALAENWDGRLEAQKSWSLGNEDLGARFEAVSGVANDVRPAMYEGMYGYGMIFGEDLELFAAEVHVASEGANGEERESYGGLRIAGIQIVSSTEAARQRFQDENVLSYETPHIPLFTLGGVVTFSLEFGASAGYELDVSVTPGRNLSTIRGRIEGFAEAEVSVNIDLLGGLASAGVRAVVQFFDRRLNTYQQVAWHHRWWNPSVRDRGVSLRLELFAEVIGLPELTLTIVDIESTPVTEYMYE